MKKINATIDASHKLNIKPLIDFEFGMNWLLTDLISNTNDFIKLWTLYEQGDISINSLKSLSVAIEDRAAKIDKTWNHLESENSSFVSKLYLVYYSYLLTVRNAPYSADRIYKKRRLFLSQQMEHVSIDPNLTTENLK